MLSDEISVSVLVAPEIGDNSPVGNPLVEATPEMVDAGVAVLTNGYDLCGHFAARGIVRNVYEAMCAVASEPRAPARERDHG